MKGLKRLFGGESFFRNTFTAAGGQGEVLFATPLCGDMAVLDVGPQAVVHPEQRLRRVEPVGRRRRRRCGGFKGMFSGAGFFVLETQGMGQVIIGTFGALEAVQVDGSMVIDTGHLAAWESTLQYKVGKSGSGWIASFLSGEGLVCHFEGQGTVYLQSRNAARVRIGDRRDVAPARAVNRGDRPCDTRSGTTPTSASVQVVFDQPGEQLITESGAMVARDSGVEMKTSLQGGIGGALKRKLLGGESLFQNTFTATAPGQTLWFAPAPEGAIECITIQPGMELFLQSGAYLASTPGVTLDTKWQGAKGFFSGGLFLLRAYGQGYLWFNCYGGLHAVDIGQQYYGLHLRQHAHGRVHAGAPVQRQQGRRPEEPVPRRRRPRVQLLGPRAALAPDAQPGLARFVPAALPPRQSQVERLSDRARS